MLSFTDISKRNPTEEAKNTILMGLEMIRIIRNVRAIINFEELDMRIGVHTVGFKLKTLFDKIIYI